MTRIPVHFDLNTIEWKKTRYPGISVRFMRTDKVTGDATVMILMEAGCGYPPHKHIGDEEILVLAGGYRDHKATYATGDYVVNPAGSVHHPIATESGPCILFAFAHGGIELVEKGSEAKEVVAPVRQFERLIDRWADNSRVLEWHGWWAKRTEELRDRHTWLTHRKELKGLKGDDVLAFLEEETHRLTMRWPLGLFATQRRKVASSPDIAKKIEHLLWSEDPVDERIDAAISGEDAFVGAGPSIAWPALLLQTAFPEKYVGLLSSRFASQVFPVAAPAGATPGEKFALLSSTVVTAWRKARPGKALNIAHWVLWMEYASHHQVRVAIFRA